MSLKFSGGGGKQPPAPTRVSDNLRSEDTVEILIGLGEGPWKGLKDDSLKNLFIADTPLEAADGTLNFPDAQVIFHKGSADPDPIQLFMGGTATPQAVGVNLSSGEPVTRTTVTGDFDAIDIRIRIDSLYKTTDEGDYLDEEILYRVEIKRSSEVEWKSIPTNAGWNNQYNQFTDINERAQYIVDNTAFNQSEAEQIVLDDLRENGNGVFDENEVFASYSNSLRVYGATQSPTMKEIRIPVERLETGTYDIRVTKVSPETTNKSIREITWESYEMVSTIPKAYPNTAMLQLLLKSSDQLSNIPQIYGVYDTLEVKVPTIFDPVTRNYDYSGGPWDGSFKIAHTDSLAWHIYNLIHNDVHGIAKYYQIEFSKYEAEKAALWWDACDPVTGQYVGVPRANGSGTRPRITYNNSIDTPRNSMEMLAYLAGAGNAVFYEDSNGVFRLRVEKEEQAQHIFTEHDIEGDFSYSYTDTTTRYNDITVVYKNADLPKHQEDRRKVVNQDDIDEKGSKPFNFIAVGCTDTDEAMARAQHKLITSLTETETVSFNTSRKGMYVEPHDVILISDPDMARGESTRAISVSSDRLTITGHDLIVPQGIAGDYLFKTQTKDGIFTSQVTAFNGKDITIADALPTNVTELFSFAVDSAQYGALKAYRAMAIVPDDDDYNKISIVAVEVNLAKFDAVDNFDSSAFNTVEAPDTSSNAVTDLTAQTVERATVDGRVKDIELVWGSSENRTTGGTYVVYQTFNEGPPTVVQQGRSQTYTKLNAQPGRYSFTISPVMLNGNVSSEGRRVPVTVVEADYGLPNITGVTIQNQNNSAATYIGQNVNIEWSVDTSEKWEGWASDKPHPDFAWYEIDVVDSSNGSIVHTYELTDWKTKKLEILYEDFKDFGLASLRNFSVVVSVSNAEGNEGSSFSRSITKPSPTLSNVVFSQPSELSERGKMSFTVPTNPDYKGVKVWVSQTVNASVTGNLQWDGEGTPVLDFTTGLNYIAYAAKDTFGSGTITNTTFTATVVDIAQAIADNTQGVDELVEVYGDTVSSAANAAAALAARTGAEAAQGQSEAAKLLSQTARDASVAAKGLAEGAATASTTAKGLAETARDASVAAKGLAETARDNAQTFSNTASSKAALAVTAASDAEDSADASANSASQASASETAAGQAASSATTQANTAATKAGEASTSAGQAATSSSNAEGSENQAGAFATNAANSATASGNSASAAAGSASLASTKATEASQSASSATTQANTATTKAGEANASAGQAATSESNAEGSANSAASSATVSATSASASYDTANQIGQSLLHRLEFFTDRVVDDLSDVADAQNGYSAIDHAAVVDDAIFGPCIEISQSESIAQRRTISVEGKTHVKVTFIGRIATDSNNGQNGNVAENDHDMRYYEADGTEAGALSISVNKTHSAAEGVWSDEAIIDLSVVPSNVTEIRPYVSINIGGANAVYRLKEYRVEDWTAQMDAENSAAASATSASTAAASETAAGQSASASQASEAAASTAASNASASETTAAISETNAAGSASTAATQAGLATSAANDAGDSATSAATSASTATSEATDAAQSASAASADRVAAETAKDNAAGSATAAAASASTATSEATNAGQSSAAAAASATEAGTQAGNASVSAGNAATSESNAAGSASSAAAAETVVLQAQTDTFNSALLTVPTSTANIELWTDNPFNNIPSNPQTGYSEASPLWSVVDDPTYGKVLETTDRVYLCPKGVLQRSEGEQYKIEITGIIVDDPTVGDSSDVVVAPAMRFYNAAGDQIGADGIPNESFNKADGVWTISVIYDWSGESADYVQARPYILVNEPDGVDTNGRIQIHSWSIKNWSQAVAADNSASASATSAASAAASSTSAGGFATAAQSAALGAETAETGAAASASTAVAAASNASASETASSNSASAAAGSAGSSASSAAAASAEALLAQQSSNVSASLAVGSSWATNPAFAIWADAAERPTGWDDYFGSNGTYVRETSITKFGTDALRTTVPIADRFGFRAYSYSIQNGAYGITPDIENTRYVVVSAWVYLVSGSWDGAGLYLNYRQSSTQSSVAVETLDFKDLGLPTGKWVYAQGLLEFSQSSVDDSDWVVFYGMANHPNHGTETAKDLIWGSCSVRAATPQEIEANKVTSIEASVTDVSTATANLEGWAAATRTIQTNVNGEMSGLEIRSATDGAITTSDIKLSAEDITIGGSTFLQIISGLVSMNAPLAMTLGSKMLVLGPGFGANSDLLFWYGSKTANLETSNLTKQQATRAMTIDDGSWGGGAKEFQSAIDAEDVNTVSPPTSGTHTADLTSIGSNGNTATATASVVVASLRTYTQSQDPFIGASGTSDSTTYTIAGKNITVDLDMNSVQQATTTTDGIMTVNCTRTYDIITDTYGDWTVSEYWVATAEATHDEVGTSGNYDYTARFDSINYPNGHNISTVYEMEVIISVTEPS